jgi:hypothetical protein
MTAHHMTSLSGARGPEVTQGKIMRSKRRPWLFAVLPALLLAGAMLQGCAAGDAVVFKTLAGEIPGEKGTIPPQVANGPIGVAPPALGGTRFRKDQALSLPGARSKPKTAKKKPATTTAAAAALARRNDALRAQVYRQDDELQRIRRSIKLHHAAYTKAVSGFGLAKERRLPEDDAAYRENMREARSRIGRLNGDLLKLNALAARINATATQTRRLVTSLRTTQGRTRDRTARRELAALAPLVQETDALPRKMLAEIQVDIGKQRAYAREQSRGLDQLAEAVAADIRRPTTRVRQLEAKNIEAAIKLNTAKDAPAGRSRSAKPLVRIRFTRADVNYKTALYRALQAALKQRPDLAFEVVGVAPSEARQPGALTRAQEVRFAMADMGVPPERVTITTETSPAATSDEVRVFVR